MPASEVLAMITSPTNNLIKKIRKIKSGKNKDFFLMEGEKYIKDLPAYSQPVFIVNETYGGSPPEPFYIVKNSLFNALSETVTPQGIMAICKRPGLTLQSFSNSENLSFLLLLDKISDPGNMGTIVRTALACGVDGVIITPGSVDVYSPKAVRAGAGAMCYLNIVQNVDYSEIIDFLRAAHIKLIAASPLGKDFTGGVLDIPLCLAIGNEARGLSSEIEKAARYKIALPMAGGESLNAAVACGILLYEVYRRETAA